MHFFVHLITCDRSSLWSESVLDSIGQSAYQLLMYRNQDRFRMKEKSSSIPISPSRCLTDTYTLNLSPSFSASLSVCLSHPTSLNVTPKSISLNGDASVAISHSSYGTLPCDQSLSMSYRVTLFPPSTHLSFFSPLPF